jgi:hypothetical protein
LGLAIGGWRVLDLLELGQAGSDDPGRSVAGFLMSLCAVWRNLVSLGASTGFFHSTIKIR